ncbi:MAG: TonB-dependent receptor [Bacteroidales bacterium]|nr:TonB-dependent receptor [Bacteroidales bacterium]
MYVKQLKSGWHLKVVLSVCALFLFTGTIWAQNITVTGRVTDKDNIPQAGVSVSIYGTTQITATGFNGSYSISVPANGALSFAMIGMVTQVVAVNNRSQINVVLLEDATLLEDVVVVAYGTQKKENLSGAVSVVNVEKSLESRSVTDVGRALQGTTPGLTITTTTGDLGSDPQIRLRADFVSMGQGNANPLILVDNVEVPSLSFINPNDIESISTLKDASTTAIYGARAANGAILITLKKGSSDGRVRVTYNTNYAWGTKTKVPVNSRPDLELEYSWLQRNGNAFRIGNDPTYEFNHIGSVWYNPDMIVKVREYYEKYGFGKGFDREMVEGRDFDKRPGGGFYFYRGWDLENEFYKKWAPNNSHNLSVSGGNDKVSYNLSAGFVKQNGIYKPFDDYFARMNSSGNISVKANKYITLRSGFMFTKTDQESPFNFGDSDPYDAAYYIYRWFATYPYGTYNGIDTRNGLHELRIANKNPTKNERWYNRLNLAATIHILPGLNFDFSYVYMFSDNGRKTIGGIPTGINTFNNTPPGADLDYNFHVSPAFRTDRDYVRMDDTKEVRNTYNALLNYTKAFGKHNIKVLAGGNFEDQATWGHWSRRDNVNDYSLPEINLSGGNQTVGSSRSWWSVVGAFGRINYDYNNKYLIEFNFRRDASSKFRDGMRWASYPSGSAAWRISEENFWQPVKPYVNFLKIRGSYGSVGNQSVPSGLYYATIGQGVNSGDGNLRYWLINGNVANWVGGPNSTPNNGGPSVVNPDLTWETINTLDFGLDMRFWKDKFGLTFDWYEKRSVNCITRGDVLPSTFGATAPLVNFGTLSTKGIELEVNFNHAFRNGLRITSTATLHDYRTVVVKFASAAEPLYTDAYFQGKVMGSIYGYKVERFFTNDDFVWENGKIKTVEINGKTINLLKNLDPEYQWHLQAGNAGFRASPGDIMYKDINGDGVVNFGTNRITDMGDLSVIGNESPRYVYGFRFGGSFKGIDFDVFFQGVGKRDLYATGNMVLPGNTPAEANFAHTLDYWTESNPNAFYPRPGTSYQTNDRYMLNMAYLRCKTMTLGYTLPKQITQKAMINRVRAYVAGENLFEFDKLGHIAVDPETDRAPTASGTNRSYGRTYPYRRTVSFGLQVEF